MMKGIVGRVWSGDTITVRDGSRVKGPPREKKITISGIMVPRMGFMKDGVMTKDEPLAFEARECLRKLIIGKMVEFVLEPKTEESTREFGHVRFEGKDVAETLVSLGLAKVKGKGRGNDALDQAEHAAMAQGLGMHAKDKISSPEILNDRSDGVDHAALINMAKGVPQPAIIEAVFGAGSMRVILLPSEQIDAYYNIGFSLSGVRTPAMRKDQPEAFAHEAKFFVESRILNRDVEVVLEQAQNNQVYGTIKMREGNISEALIRNGFGTLAQWSLVKCSCALQLREAEKVAKRNKLRLWRNYTPQQTSEFVGKVVEVATGDTLVIQDEQGDARSICLSSIRTNRLRNDEGRVDPVAAAAKECIRKMTIGRKVNVMVEYKRDFEGNPDKPNQAKITRVYATVRQNEKNVAERVVAEGFAEVVRHRDEDPRSSAYEDLMLAQAEAEKKGKGKWSTKGIAGNALTQLTADNPKRAQSFLANFQRDSRTSAVVDFVVNAARFKLQSNKHACIFSFALAGVRVPRSSRRDGKGPAAEPFGDEAYMYTRGMTLQRDVKVEVESCDRGGTFMGRMMVAGKCLSVELLSLGYGSLHPASAERLGWYQDLWNAEEQAKAARVGIWANYVPVDAAAQERLEREAQEKAAKGEFMECTATEVISGQEFYLRPNSAPPLEAKVANSIKMAEAAAAGAGSTVPAPSLKPGTVVAARYSADGTWYRARVMKDKEAVDKGQVTVRFIDYGNCETMAQTELRSLDPTLGTLPPQAYPCTLAFLRVPGLEAEYGVEAAETVASLIMGRSLVAKIEKRGDPMEVSIAHKETSLSVPGQMLEDGLASVRSRKRIPKYVAKQVVDDLLDAQQVAKSRRLRIWEYGDVPDSDDEQ